MAKKISELTEKSQVSSTDYVVIDNGTNTYKIKAEKLKGLSSWSEIQSKPFNSIGSGLSVVNGSLTANPNNKFILISKSVSDVETVDETHYKITLTEAESEAISHTPIVELQIDGMTQLCLTMLNTFSGYNDTFLSYGINQFDDNTAVRSYVVGDMFNNKLNLNFEDNADSFTIIRQESDVQRVSDGYQIQLTEIEYSKIYNYTGKFNLFIGGDIARYFVRIGMKFFTIIQDTNGIHLEWGFLSDIGTNHYLRVISNDFGGGSSLPFPIIETTLNATLTDAQYQTIVDNNGAVILYINSASSKYIFFGTGHGDVSGSSDYYFTTVPTYSNRTVSGVTKPIIFNLKIGTNKKVPIGISMGNYTLLPDLPSNNGEYKLKITNGVPSWVAI